jgi:hypothetical protein
MPLSPPAHQTLTPTPWSMIRRAKGDGLEAENAVRCLTERYYRPLKVFAFKMGRLCPDPEEATHGFIEHLLESCLWQKADADRGRLRNFLMSSFKNFALNEWRSRKKREGIEMPMEHPAEAEDPVQTATAACTREWAVTVFRAARNSRRERWAARNEEPLFDDLVSYISGASGSTSENLGLKYGKSAEAIRTKAVRLKEELRDALVEEIRDTIEEPTDATIRQEMLDLMNAFEGMSHLM